jgi:thioredoxin reductase
MPGLPSWQTMLAYRSAPGIVPGMDTTSTAPSNVGPGGSDIDAWDCIVVGGGAAGLSAALVLGRARRRTLVLDAGRQSNRPAAGVGGLLGHDGRPPDELYAAGRDELAVYPSVEVRAGEVRAGERGEGGFVLELDGGAREAARRVLLATGMEYRHPDIPGIAERWGGTVFHCPFCHGWEVRERPLAVLDAGPTGVERAVLLRMWSDDVALLTDGPASLAPEEAARLEAAGVVIDERPVAGLLGAAPELTGIAFADGGERACEGLLVAVTLHQRSTLAAQLGATAAAPNPLVADGVETGPAFETGVPGLFAAGDLTGQMQSVANAVAAGSLAAAMVVRSLATEP